MSWRVAFSLTQIKIQADLVWPNRSKASDGTIGDAAHASRTSDHNPDDRGIVRARDITHDPDAGADMHRLAEALRASQDPRIKYVIWDGRMFSSYLSTKGRKPWEWGLYTGPNPHTTHLHLSVVADDRADETHLWQIGDRMHTTKDHANYHGLGPNTWGDDAWQAFVAAKYTSRADSRTWEVRREDLAVFRENLLDEIRQVVRDEIATAGVGGVDVEAITATATSGAVRQIIHQLTNG